MPTVKGKTQVTFHLDDEDFEDMTILASRRGQTKSEFLRRAIQNELLRDAMESVENA